MNLEAMKSLLRPRLLAGLAVAVASYALAGFVLAPWLVERQLVAMLDERLDLAATFGRVSINPFTLTLELEDVTVIEPGGERFVRLEGALLDLELVSVLWWAAAFREVNLAGLELRVERFSEKDSNLHRLAARWAETAAPEGEVTAEDEDPALPRFHVDDLRF
ncbi:MAG TPA: hypothetical protein VMP10_03415, partial [Chloroflexota bacterium]|nr:hypothetical protein [Chloroflexota bacterium]